MHWAPCIAALAVGLCAGYVIHNMRGRMMTERERRDLAALREKTAELQAVIDQVMGLVQKRDAERMHPRA